MAEMLYRLLQCWFANVFSNVLILRAFSKKKIKNKKFYLNLSSLFLRFFIKIFIFLFMCQLTPKLIYIHQNKVFSAFLPNFIPKINKTGVLWYRISKFRLALPRCHTIYLSLVTILVFHFSFSQTPILFSETPDFLTNCLKQTFYRSLCLNGAAKVN